MVILLTDDLVKVAGEGIEYKWPKSLTVTLFAGDLCPAVDFQTVISDKLVKLSIYFTILPFV